MPARAYTPDGAIVAVTLSTTPVCLADVLAAKGYIVDRDNPSCNWGATAEIRVVSSAAIEFVILNSVVTDPADVNTQYATIPAGEKYPINVGDDGHFKVYFKGSAEMVAEVYGAQSPLQPI